jgi:hypothetical protein
MCPDFPPGCVCRFSIRLVDPKLSSTLGRNTWLQDRGISYVVLRWISVIFLKQMASSEIKPIRIESLNHLGDCSMQTCLWYTRLGLGERVPLCSGSFSMQVQVRAPVPVPVLVLVLASITEHSFLIRPNTRKNMRTHAHLISNSWRQHIRYFGIIRCR